MNVRRGGLEMDAVAQATGWESVADLLTSLGGISPNRVQIKPMPGTATVDDVVRLRDTTRRIFELVDGTLVEKVMGFKESAIALRLSRFIDRWNADNGDVGVLTGADGTIKLMGALVRAPDLSFTFLDRLPNRCIPDEPVPDIAPDLAVEVLSEGNTREEMERKLKEYFLSEVQLVWYIDPRKQTVKVYTSPDNVEELGEGDSLNGGDVLPGFSVPVSALFEQLSPAAKPSPPKANGGKKPKKRK
jgi:Uma2 family endonuclease